MWKASAFDRTLFESLRPEIVRSLRIQYYLNKFLTIHDIYHCERELQYNWAHSGTVCSNERGRNETGCFGWENKKKNIYMIIVIGVPNYQETSLNSIRSVCNHMIWIYCLVWFLLLTNLYCSFFYPYFFFIFFSSFSLFSLKCICPCTNLNINYFFLWQFFCSEIYYILLMKAYGSFLAYIYLLIVRIVRMICYIMANKLIWINTSCNLDWHIVIPA